MRDYENKEFRDKPPAMPIPQGIDLIHKLAYPDYMAKNFKEKQWIDRTGELNNAESAKQYDVYIDGVKQSTEKLNSLNNFKMRETGYYWVKIKEWAGNEWVIAEYDGGGWTYRDMDSLSNRSIMPYEINETRILNPDEK